MEVKCDYCGKLFEYKESPAHYNRTKRHYCSRSCQGNGNNIIQGNQLHGLAKHKNGKQDTCYQLWCQAKRRAKKKGRKFDLSPIEIPIIPEFCPVLGIPIRMTGKLTGNSPTIDRIDNTKGYVKDNIRIISYRANRLKADATIEELKLIIKDLESIHERI